MSNVFGPHAVSTEGDITGRDPDRGRELGNETTLFDWYTDGDTPAKSSTSSG